MRSFPLLEESGTRSTAATAERSTSRCSVRNVRHSCVSARPRSAGTAACRSVMLLMVLLVAGRGVEAFSNIGSRTAVHIIPLPARSGHMSSSSSARPKLDYDVTKHCSKSTATSSMLFASSSQSSPNGEPPIRSIRAARIFSSLCAHLQKFQSSLGKHTKVARRIIAVVLLATAVFLGGAVDPALAGRSGGRAGGSFGRSYRAPPMSRPMHRPGAGSMGGGMRSSPMLHPGMYRRHPAIYFMPRPGYYNRRLSGSGAAVADAPTTNKEGGAVADNPNGDGSDSENGEVIEMKELMAQNGERISPNGVSSRRGTKVIDPITYYAALTGVYGLIVYKANRSKNSNGGNSANGVVSALGPGISVGSLTLSLDISDRDDPNNALARIGGIAKKANTRTRKGVQSMISDVALELLRQEASVSSACSSYAHLSSEGAAERTYYQLSTVERSKFDRESINKFGGKKGMEEEILEDADNIGRVSGEVPANKATSAVVTIIYQIEGDQTKMPTITSRSDLKNVLLRIAADAQTEECLLGAEVLWTPERRGDSMTEQEVVSLYPELRIL